MAWRFLAPVRPGDVITAEATVTAARDDKPVTTLATTVTNQDGVVVLYGTAVVWRDPVVAGTGEPGEGADPGVRVTTHTDAGTAGTKPWRNA